MLQTWSAAMHAVPVIVMQPESQPWWAQPSFWIPTIISVLSVIVSVVLTTRANRISRSSAEAADRSAKAAEDSAKATEAQVKLARARIVVGPEKGEMYSALRIINQGQTPAVEAQIVLHEVWVPIPPLTGLLPPDDSARTIDLGVMGAGDTHRLVLITPQGNINGYRLKTVFGSVTYKSVFDHLGETTFHFDYSQSNSYSAPIEKNTVK